MTTPKEKDIDMNISSQHAVSVFGTSNLEQIKSQRALIESHERSHKLSLFSLVGVALLVLMSFLQMIFGVLLILDQIPETSWIMKSALSLF
ncbi:hypothetical protein [Halobacteriovorax sp. HLS]|uniref:hypothetical protein n=1 Tax=Halobacteriovorax sp. HLS TaxID=2234000 RepID=UPI000FD8D2BD|nr:hypothetical protein [Halobacteriovorax sp. HLS]